MSIEEFNTRLFNFYSKNKRDISWRETINPYHVVLTELMLQQTQVPRVQEKFPQFIAAFPSFHDLAQAPMIDILSAWQGMGYNRRAKYLKEIATIIVERYNGEVPRDPDQLDAMPGIGPATARSIITYIYNVPELFIETNVRRVFIHHFFEDQPRIADSDIYPLLEKAVDKQNPREWYYAVMDYGTYLGKTVQNPNRRSKHYVKQSKFEGSRRQVRGGILRELIKEPLKAEALVRLLGFERKQVFDVLKELEGEGFIAKNGDSYKIK